MARETIELETGPNIQASIIWLHGLGADGHDFEPIVPELNLPKHMHVRFIFPHAPVRPVTTHGGMPLRAWYDLFSWELHAKQDIEGIDASIQSIQRLIAKEITRGRPSHKIFLAGFSQGGAIALQAAFACPNPLAGVIALSSYLPLPDRLTEIHPANTSLPIFLAHGVLDPVVPYFLGQQTLSVLESRGFKPDFSSYQMVHCVCSQEIEALGAWITARLT